MHSLTAWGHSSTHVNSANWVRTTLKRFAAKRICRRLSRGSGNELAKALLHRQPDRAIVLTAWGTQVLKRSSLSVHIIEKK